MAKKKSLKMKQSEISSLVDEIFAHAQSLKEDVDYGISHKHKIFLTSQDQSALYEISTKLMRVSEAIGVQFIIQDFE
ncbi:MAG: hypothetical protein CME70_05755 [Halobacteriovorax sp.]|mgnify:CR=1 FL=1|nr:hypothetical protein [Halobacteriovorax sp.]|tara:strand:- start:374 stop:604 length:231 start_codon:yes stop_codon:yes gene_type:complete